jgi:hypothetical protein
LTSQLPVLPAELTDRPRTRRALIGFWIVVAIAVAACIPFASGGWDIRVYTAAIHSLRAGHDPYADAMAIQRLYHSQAIVNPDGDPPYSYVYSPITLPLVGLVGRLPFWLSGGAYWSIFGLGVLGQSWFALRFTEDSERRYFLYLAPIAAFFPGMLENGTVLGGNIAYILYPAVLLCAAVGWRSGNWRWFYAATLAASCVKAPLLSLIVIPLLSARKQWLPAGLTATAGVGLFAMQPFIWPSLFKNYLQAVDLQFLYNRDFGCSPAGLFSDFLYTRGIPYAPAGLIFYLCYAMPLLALLWYLSRRFLRGGFALGEWIPVLLVGVILLNPRIMEYDVAPITLLLALIAWRFFARFTKTTQTIVCMGLLFAAANSIAAFGWYIRKLVDGPLLIIVFAAGCWTLMRRSSDGVVAPDLECEMAAAGLN